MRPNPENARDVPTSSNMFSQMSWYSTTVFCHQNIAAFLFPEKNVRIGCLCRRCIWIIDSQHINTW